MPSQLAQGLESFMAAMQQSQARAQIRKAEQQKEAGSAAFFRTFDQPDPIAAPPQGGPGNGPITMGPGATAPMGPGATAPMGQQPQNANPLAALGQMLSASKGAAPTPAVGAPQGQMPNPTGMQGTQPIAPQPMKPPVNPNLSATAQPQSFGGTQGGQPDAMAEATQNLRSAARALKAANPKADDYTLSLALQQYVENMKGLAPLTKATMVAQTAVLTNQSKMQQVQLQVQSRVDAAKERGANAQEVERIRIEGLEEVARINGYNAGNRQEMKDDTSIKTAEMRETGANSRAQLSHADRQSLAGAKTAAQAKTAVAQIAGRARTAAIAAGADPADAEAAANAAATQAMSLISDGGGAAAKPQPQRYGAGGAPAGKGPVKVNTPADAAKLPKGTHYVTPDGQQLIR